MFKHEQHKLNNLMQLENLLCPEIKIRYANLLNIHPVSQIYHHIPSKQIQHGKSIKNSFVHKKIKSDFSQYNRSFNMVQAALEQAWKDLS